MRHEAPACEPGSAEGIRFSGPDPVSRRSARRWSKASARSRAAQPPGNDRPASSASVWHRCQQYGRALVGSCGGRRVQVRLNSPIRMAGRLEVPGKSREGTGGPVEDEAGRRCGPACLGAGAREPVRRPGGVRQAWFVTWLVALVVPPAVDGVLATGSLPSMLRAVAIGLACEAAVTVGGSSRLSRGTCRRGGKRASLTGLTFVTALRRPPRSC